MIRGTEPAVSRPGGAQPIGKRTCRFPAVWAILLAGVGPGGCRSPAAPPVPDPARIRILDFAMLGDSALAVRFEAERPSGEGPARETLFVRLDRRKASAAALESPPADLGPTFPAWFFACENGRPVSVHPPGFSGPAGSCSPDPRPAIGSNGYTVVFAKRLEEPDSNGIRWRVTLFSHLLETYSVRDSRQVRVAPLEVRSDSGLVGMLEEPAGPSDSAEWRWFATDDASGSEAVSLRAPARLRIHGRGVRLICSPADEAAHPLACWSTAAPAGFREAFAEAAAGDPEWHPGTGELAYLEAPARFVFLRPATGVRSEWDARAVLEGFAARRR